MGIGPSQSEVMGPNVVQVESGMGHRCQVGRGMGPNLVTRWRGMGPSLVTRWGGVWVLA